MSMSVEAAAQALREAMRETVKRHSLWYLIQGALMVVAGILALNLSGRVVGRSGVLSRLVVDN